MAGERVLNVCFHGIGEPIRALEPGEERYWVPTDRFHRILDELSGWPRLRISFDDGNASDLQIGLPALLQRGLRADFFVIAGRLGQRGSLDADGVRQLRRCGMSIGSHGMRHRSWRGLAAAEAVEELIEARQRLAAVAGAEVHTAACPLGAYDRRVLNELRRLGYTRIYTSDRRHARRGSWLQPRYSVRADDTPNTLRAEVLAGSSKLRRARNAAAGLVKRWR